MAHKFAVAHSKKTSRLIDTVCFDAIQLYLYILLHTGYKEKSRRLYEIV